MSEDSSEIERRVARTYRRTVIVSYSLAAVVATLSGLFAASPWWVCAALFGALKLGTLFTSAMTDDWANDFHGDNVVMIKGTMANAVVVVAFTALGVALQAL